ncbi:phenylalanine--tRNA ligase subunit beta [Azonexus sp.]|uniref:phenylalanine--tRNA ligase subunit beta n=1 Tax=Azonexus sp. TaxID=1872668 RepID=UPI0039E318A1
MKFSESWLRSFVNPALTSAELSHCLTMAGLEVEDMRPVAPAFSGVIVAQVLSVNKHPDADRLNICQVDIGPMSETGTPQQIVCGAPNVAAGMKVPCALPGAQLPGDFKIKLAKVRGIESSGMLCSAKELGISDEASGLLALPADAPIGQNIRDYLALDDTVFEIKLTPNRADCLSLKGIAREVGAITGTPVNMPQISPVAPATEAFRPVTLHAGNACPLYCGRIIKDVNARAATPDWLRRHLERSGLRSISALVDITNYVMLELGQPLHAFDNAKLRGAIEVRMAHEAEQLLLLNEQKITLSPDLLVIADEKEALALGGIMGGKESGITLDTQELFLEAAFFAPSAIAGRARRYNFASDASHRFERGVDFGATQAALERATQLILTICGGQAGPVSSAQSTLPERPSVHLRTARAAKVLGVPLDSARIATLLQGLALPFTQSGDEFLVTPPSWRFDMEIEEDLIEEIARLIGYDAIPANPPQAALRMLPQPENERPAARIRQFFADRGYQEVINFAFIDSTWEADFSGKTEESQLIRLANPIASHMAVMRSSLFGGLVDNLATNLKRQQSRVRLFELGRTFARSTQPQDSVQGYRQTWQLAGLAYGPALPETWTGNKRPVDFYDLKGDLEALFPAAGLRFEQSAHPALHPGRAARIVLQERTIGYLGELHPQWVQKYELSNAPVLFEIDFSALTSQNLPTFSEFSRFPAITRDLAIVVDQELPWQAILDALHDRLPAQVTGIQLFDVYTGKGIPENKKSLALRVVMQDTQRTLLDSDVDAAMQYIATELENKFAAQLRA